MKNGTYEGIDSYIPQIDNPKNEIFGYQKPKIKQKFAELWTKVKANNKTSERDMKEVL